MFGETIVVGITYTKGQILENTYEIVDEIGEGGAGVIYLAIHHRLQKYVILKKIKEGVVGKIDTRKEVDMLKGLHHKYLPQVYDFFQDGANVYTVLDYIEGNDLSYYIHNSFRVPEELVIKWLLQLTEVLEYLHNHHPQIIHSDIKPSNIIINSDMDVCLIDFNISMSDGSGSVSGITPAYSSPEQIANSMGYPVPIDQKTDIYSLGATFYHVMSLIKPQFSKDAIVDYSPMYEFYRTSLIDVIKIAMNQRPNNRFQSAHEMHRAIEKTTDEYKKKQIRNIILAASGVLVTLGLVAGSVSFFTHKREKLERQYSADYNEVVNEYNSSDYDPDELRQEIDNSLLNNGDYEKILKKKNNQEAELNYIKGYTYYLEENYESAIGCYETAIKSDKSCGKAYRELSICHSRIGDYSNAQYYLDNAREADIEDVDMALMQAELSYAKKAYQDALDESTRLAESGNGATGELIIRAAMVGSKASQELGDFTQFIESFRGVNLSGNDMTRLNRLLLNACIYEAGKEAESEEDELTVNSYYNQALVYGEKVMESDAVEVDDVLGLARVYTYLEMYDKARELLNGSEFIYTDYRINMWLACVEYKSSGQERLNSTASMYYEQAKGMPSYSTAYNEGTVDPIMNQLGELQ